MERPILPSAERALGNALRLTMRPLLATNNNAGNKHIGLLQRIADVSYDEATAITKVIDERLDMKTAEHDIELGRKSDDDEDDDSSSSDDGAMAVTTTHAVPPVMPCVSSLIVSMSKTVSMMNVNT